MLRTLRFWKLVAMWVVIELIATFLFLLWLTPPAFAQPPALTQTDPRVSLGLVPPQVMEGARLFFEETFRGNGRTCGTCHLAEDNLTIDAAEIRRLPLNSPIFAPRVPGLERFDVLRSHGLILENVDGLTAPPMFRSTPHTLSLATSITSTVDVPPGTDTVGWDGRGSPGAGTLRDFATGAVVQHFTRSLARRPGTDFRLPTEAELDALLAFQLSTGRTADIDLAQVRFLDPRAERGRVFFEDDGVGTNQNCQRCHDNAGANRADGSGNQNKDTGVDDLRVAGLPHDDGRGAPGDETFSPPPLIEAADTAPFFHTNTIASLEAAVMFYSTPVFTGQVQTFTAAQGAEVGLMLRMLNASLNAQMALQRIEAAGRIVAAFPDHPAAQRLLDLAHEEAVDGVSVLHGHSKLASDFMRCAQRTKQAAKKLEIDSAKLACEFANRQIGTGLTMRLGAGNLAM